MEITPIIGFSPRWRNGQMALRWCAAGMFEAGNQFRRINGHLHPAALREALEAEATQTVRTSRCNETVNAA